MTPKTTIPRTTHQKALNASAALSAVAMKLNGSATLQSLKSARDDADRALEVARALRAEISRLVVQAERETTAHLEEMGVLRRVGA